MSDFYDLDCDTEPQPPTPPEDGRCCESGCGDNCVWTRYEVERAYYQLKLQRWRAKQGPR